MRVRAVVASAVLLCLVAPAARALELRPGEEPYLAGTSPAALATGDLDRDGDADLVVADAPTGDVSILLGDGAGGFVAGSISYPSAPDPVQVALGDLDRDGILDLVTAGRGSNRLHYRLGNGSGGFRGLRTKGTGSSAPSGVVVIDMNADGRLDLVTANPGSATVSVIRGDGHGDFAHAPGSPYSAAVEGAAVAAGDLNGDARPDVVVCGPQGVGVLVNAGNGRLMFTHLEPAPASDVDLARLDGDDRLDAVVATPTGVVVLHGDGTGRFAGPATAHPAGAGPTTVAIGDLDADRSSDIVYAATDGLHVLLADGEGSHTEAGNSPWAAGADARDISTPDVDADGLRDVAVADGDGVYVNRNTSTRGLSADPGSVDFGPQPVGVSAVRTVSVTGVGLPTDVEGVSLDSTAFSVAADGCSGRTVADARPPCAVSVRYTPPQTGGHAATLRITTEAGEVGVPLAGSGVDVDAPETTITDRPSDPTTDETPTFAFSSSEDGSTFTCRVDEAAHGPCTSPYTTDPLAPGTHSFEVAATDAAGNTDPTPAVYRFAVTAPPPDVAPDTTITEHPPALTNDTTPTFRFTSDSAGSTFVCSLDGAEPAVCTSPHTTDVLDEGSHSFSVAAVSPAGQVDPTPDTFEVTIDLRAPRTEIRGPSSPTRRRARYTFRFTEDVARVQCSIDGSGFSDCKTPYNARALRPGRHVLRVQATDPAGNVESPAAVKRFRIVRS